MAPESAPAMDLSQALDLLNQLRGAAPADVSARLNQLADLLMHFADENAYLNTRLMEEMPAAPAREKPAPAAEPPAGDKRRTVTGMLRQAGETDPTVTFFTGLNDALRPPLIAIRGRAELVQAGLLGQITAEQDHWLQAIQENTGRAFAVLDALQEIISLQKGQLRIEPVNFISTDLLSEGWERVRDRAKQFGHEISIQAPEIVPLARGDFYQCLIILTDLLDNAIRYTPPGGKIRMSVDNLGTHVLFSVVDNGIGLSASDLENVTKPFWRAHHNKLVHQHPGTGLRLYLAKQWLALQDGELIFSGEPGLGASFSFTLRIPE